MFELRRINGYSILAERQSGDHWVILCVSRIRTGYEYVIATVEHVHSHHFTATAVVDDFSDAVKLFGDAS